MNEINKNEMKNKVTPDRTMWRDKEREEKELPYEETSEKRSPCRLKH
jgi:hypothetical protein